jgi:hypothetical protein
VPELGHTGADEGGAQQVARRITGCRIDNVATLDRNPREALHVTSSTSSSGSEVLAATPETRPSTSAANASTGR